MGRPATRRTARRQRYALRFTICYAGRFSYPRAFARRHTHGDTTTFRGTIRDARSSRTPLAPKPKGPDALGTGDLVVC